MTHANVTSLSLHLQEYKKIQIRKNSRNGVIHSEIQMDTVKSKVQKRHGKISVDTK